MPTITPPNSPNTARPPEVTWPPPRTQGPANDVRRAGSLVKRHQAIEGVFSSKRFGTDRCRLPRTFFALPGIGIPRHGSRYQGGYTVTDPPGANGRRAGKVDFGGLSREGMTLRRGERTTPEDDSMRAPYMTTVPNALQPYPGNWACVNNKIQDVGAPGFSAAS